MCKLCIKNLFIKLLIIFIPQTIIYLNHHLQSLFILNSVHLNCNKVHVNISLPRKNAKHWPQYRHLLMKVDQKQWRSPTRRVWMRWKREMRRSLREGMRWSVLKRNLKKSNSLLLNCSRNFEAGFYT